MLSLDKRVLREHVLSAFNKPHAAPIFVFGVQKSGTTAIARLFSTATGQQLISDFVGAREPHIGRLLRGETSVPDFVAANAWAFSAPVVKEPSLTFVAPDLLDHFPLRRAIFIVRDPWQTIRSTLARLEMRGDAEDIASAGRRKINATWQSILTGRDLGLMRDNYIGILAKRWVRALDVCEQLGDQVVVLRYEDFCKSKVKSIGMLAEKFGFTGIRDISTVVDHQFQKSGRVDVEAAEFFGVNLPRIAEVCADKAWRYGYTEQGAKVDRSYRAAAVGGRILAT